MAGSVVKECRVGHKLQAWQELPWDTLLFVEAALAALVHSGGAISFPLFQPTKPSGPCLVQPIHAVAHASLDVPTILIFGAVCTHESLCAMNSCCSRAYQYLQLCRHDMHTNASRALAITACEAKEPYSRRRLNHYTMRTSPLKRLRTRWRAEGVAQTQSHP
ncbi:uncharacterized protein M421DRAFT_416413 [Didymella exigua CBS 183.55]|uniref:Uncharacterized protein n=1 Tax=Didymella exigua CBS 183.55 TaxID=1150837 RepID=A0A6A5RY93_9PLEO|nr:uncharacterized protein M421DRAFT_416413 [Didymella exigua CBS 183.55]KAF1932802.1 hypothetical protein M421DRAFT_416413 [Didymella exigua CBS 183.55]